MILFFRTLKFIGAIILIALLVIHIDWTEVAQHFRDINFLWVGVYVVIVLIGNLISVYRWQHLARVHGLHERICTLFAMYVTASFINNFLPGFIGGDTYRSYQLGHKNNNVLPAALSVIVDRIVGLFGILILASAIGLWLFFDPSLQMLQEVRILIIGTVSITFIAWLCMLWRYEIIDRFSRFLPHKYTQYVVYVHNYTTLLLWQATRWSVFFGLIGIGVANYILFVALGSILPIIPYLFFVLIASIISAIPVSIGNFGIKEWSYITLFGLMSVGASTAVAVVLLGRVVQALISTIGVPLYFIQKNTTDTKIFQS